MARPVGLGQGGIEEGQGPPSMTPPPRADELSITKFGQPKPNDPERSLRGGKTAGVTYPPQLLENRDGGSKITDGGWRATEGGWKVTDGGWGVTEGDWRTTDGG